MMYAERDCSISNKKGLPCVTIYTAAYCQTWGAQSY